MPSSTLIACPDCDLLQRIPVLAPGGYASCPRCGRVTARDKPDSLNRTFALAVAAAVTLLIANAVPMLGLSAAGREASATILGGVQDMWNQGQRLVSLVVLFTAVIAPGLDIALLLTMLPAALRPPAPRWIGTLLRCSHNMQPWRMVEVMMLGILISLIKIAELARVIPGIAMWAVGALVVLLAAISSNFDPQEVWGRVKWAQSDAKRGIRGEAGAAAGFAWSSAVRHGLFTCEDCGLLSRPPAASHRARCPRCDAGIHYRKPNSIQRTWALVIAAAICYIPANILPVMTTITPFSRSEDTIMEGVVLLWSPSSWPLSIMVFIASITIPLAKLIALSYLLITIQRGSIKSNRERTRLYRMVKFIGRWSMLDVFVDTFVVALVQLPPLMTIEPGLGVVFFSAVVVFTMFAAETFDSRLIWDQKEASHG